ncbi:hypothetical protein A33Q_2539 [Indibacter alkaliphilus LW1]|uniref:Uncharacterized protein n=1 Tax=Indibacter alkaliphilus (strain CCUG 57479 / KCTC 22604 / LW1) TaxID=1189612 RepID=S2DV30_INDAL|nr:hypothetical protein A33Q_2539 [Indibacter alkaliphilus LW1]
MESSSSFFCVILLQNYPVQGIFWLLFLHYFSGSSKEGILFGFYHFIIGLSLILLLILRPKFGKRSKTQINLISITLFVVLVLELAGAYTASQKINNTLLYNIGWIYLESFLLIAYFYSLEQSLVWRKRTVQLTGLLFIWAVLNSLLFEPISGALQYYSLFPFGVLLIVLSCRLIRQILTLRIDPEKKLIYIPHFWIGFVVLFFYLEALLLFGAYQLYPEFVVKNVNIMFNLNKLMASLMYLVFGFAFILPNLRSPMTKRGSIPLYF